MPVSASQISPDKVRSNPAAAGKGHGHTKTLQDSFFSIISRLKEVHQAAGDSEQWELPPLVPSIVSTESAGNLTEEWFEILKSEASQLKPLSETVEKEHAAIQIRRSLQTDIRQAIKRIKDASGDGKRIEFVIKRGEAIKAVLHDERIRHANDTLGLCLFLALEKRENPEKTILFLDDAIASVDEAHMERLYQLLLDEAAHFHHVIISSHYQPLRFKFRLEMPRSRSSLPSVM